LFTAFLTAFYTFRALFLTFFGEQRIPHEAGHHAHESPPRMTVPLMILAVCATVLGAYFEWTHGFAHFIALTPSLAYAPMAETAQPAFHLDIAAISTVVALAGVGLAAFLYLGHRREVNYLGRVSEGLDRMEGPGKSLVAMPLKTGYTLSYGKFFIDQIYDALFVWPLKMLGVVSYWVDRYLIDGLVNLCGRVPVVLGSGLRSLQTGMVQFYALAMVLGLIVLIGALLWWPTA
jgi:NADH-quinone oxidoreductase subunit L